MSISLISMTSEHFDVRKYSCVLQPSTDLKFSRNISWSISKVVQWIAEKVPGCVCCFAVNATRSSSPASPGTKDINVIIL